MPASPHDEGQVAGSATHGPRTDLELWLKGHFCWQDAKGHGDQRWNFIAYMMLFFLQHSFSAAVFLKGNQHFEHKKKINYTLLLVWKAELVIMLPLWSISSFNKQPTRNLKKRRENPLFFSPFCKNKLHVYPHFHLESITVSGSAEKTKGKISGVCW